MSYVPAIGATSLGIVIGWLVRYFIRRFDSFGPATLGSVVSIVLGGAVIKFLEADRTVWWFYPIGLFLGMLIYQIIVSGDGGSGGGSGGGSSPGIPKWGGKHNPKYLR